MPILGREIDLYPEGLLDQPPSDDAERQWLVAHTSSRREKDLARKLLARNLPFFLPQMEQKFRSPNGRRRVAYLPLFPGYVFLRAAPLERDLVLETNCVVKLLLVRDPEELVFDLRQIHKLTHSGAALVRETEFTPGMSVRITAGPFQGFEGQVLKQQSGDRLLVLIHYLQQGVSISLEGCAVEPK